MFPFSDVPRSAVLYIARAFERFEAAIDAAAQAGGAYRATGDSDAGGAASVSDVAYYYILARTLDLVGGLEDIDFAGKNFYELTGSCGRTALAAAFLFDFAKVATLEGTDSNDAQARALLSHCRKPRQTYLQVEKTSFLKYDWEDGDVVFFDASTLSEFIDEARLVWKFELIAHGLQAGSVIVLITSWERRYLGKTEWLLLSKDMNRAVNPSKTVNVWTFRKLSAAKSKTERQDLEKGLEEANSLAKGS